MSDNCSFSIDVNILQEQNIKEMNNKIKQEIDFLYINLSHLIIYLDKLREVIGVLGRHFAKYENPLLTTSEVCVLLFTPPSISAVTSHGLS